MATWPTAGRDRMARHSPFGKLASRSFTLCISIAGLRGVFSLALSEIESIVVWFSGLCGSGEKFGVQGSS